MADNQLADATSPYLLQHADNPVAWRPWGEAVLAEAQQRNVPILLSVGYAACHWCHVMAHESFEDPEIAAVMNAHFVNVKVDREERPDIDQIYQTALAAMSQHGGWPLTMFLTPQGEPFWGGTYFPKTDRFGMPGFQRVLEAIAQAWANDPDSINSNVQGLRQALRDANTAAAAEGVPAEAPQQIAQQLMRAVDWTNGGLGGAPKFPQVAILDLLWRQYIHDGNERFCEAVLLTLDRMALGGLYDHLGGGFARYCVDEVWHVPHFEKMLYDNAQLIELYSLVWQETGGALYARRVADSIAWLADEMAISAGDDGPTAFASSLDADSEGVEGKFYTWTADQIDAVLEPAEAQLVKETYGVTAEGNWEGTNVLNRSAAGADLGPEAEGRLAEARQRLAEARAERVRPGRDDKVLADWNGLAIAGLARAARAFDRRDWAELAESAFAFIATQHWDGERLRHSWRAGVAAHPAGLEDYVFMARAALALFQLDGAAAYLDWAKTFVAVLDRHFWDSQAGGYFQAADDTPALIQRPKTVNDSAVPSGNGVALGVLAALYQFTGETGYGAQAEAQARAFGGQLRENAFPLTSYLGALAFAHRCQQAVVVDPTASAAGYELLRAVEGQSLPDGLRVPCRGVATAQLPGGHPAAGKPAGDDGAPRAYLCQGGTCSRPMDSAGELATALRRARRS